MRRLARGLPVAVRFTAGLAAAGVGLAGCATTPTNPNSSASAGASRLALCPGVFISNAPAADTTRQIIAFTPQTRVRGRQLLRAPVRGCVSSGFGPRRGGAGAFHEGLDLFTREPRAISAAGDGVILRAASLRGYGRTIDIDHGNGVVSRYAHLSRFSRAIRTGARVNGGAIIGETGRSGNATAVHLHYEILVDGAPIDPLRAEFSGPQS